ncbi:unnamed protein product, partial [Mesorhabditis belari]|uniref:Uncharacterized protein n=1 Tax=Mesorhabditis belari TaxID=2138241 RepID=A0AAF3EZW0_9BILA
MFVEQRNPPPQDPAPVRELPPVDLGIEAVEALPPLDTIWVTLLTYLTSFQGQLNEPRQPRSKVQEYMVSQFEVLVQAARRDWDLTNGLWLQPTINFLTKMHENMTAYREQYGQYWEQWNPEENVEQGNQFNQMNVGQGVSNINNGQQVQFNMFFNNANLNLFAGSIQQLLQVLNGNQTHGDHGNDLFVLVIHQALLTIEKYFTLKRFHQLPSYCDMKIQVTMMIQQYLTQNNQQRLRDEYELFYNAPFSDGVLGHLLGQQDKDRLMAKCYEKDLRNMRGFIDRLQHDSPDDADDLMLSMSEQALRKIREKKLDSNNRFFNKLTNHFYNIAGYLFVFCFGFLLAKFPELLIRILI